MHTIWFRRRGSALSLSTLVLILALTLALFGLTPVAPTHAAGVIYVMPGGAGDGSSWASARDLAPALAAATSGDELWIAAGVYKPGTLRSDTFQLKSGVAIYGGFNGTESARGQRDWTTNVVTLSGDLGDNDNGNLEYYEPTRADNSYNVVRGADGAILDGVTVTGGNADYNDIPALLYYEGGGILNYAASPTIANVIVTRNSARQSGGMHNYASSATLTNVIFHNNYSNAGGGGLLDEGGSTSLTNVTFSDNFGSVGAGMANYGGSPVLTNVTFSGNNGTGGFGNSGGSATLTNVTFMGNIGGGGLWVGGGSVTVTNAVVSGNRADWGGGGVSCSSMMGTTTLSLTNVTVSGNSGGSGSGGGLSISGDMMMGGTCNATVRNSIIWGNTASTNPNIGITSSTATVSYSLVEGGLPVGATDGGNNLFVDPLFVAAVPAAPTTDGNLRLQAGSPAIDAGDSTGAAATDRDDGQRITGAAVDMGAYEIQLPGVRYVNPRATGTGSGYSWANAYTSLQAALSAAVSGDELWVAAGVYKPGTLRSDTFQLKSGVAIYGGFNGTESARGQRDWTTNVVTLSGDIGVAGDNTDNSYHVVSGGGSDASAILDGVTITGGYADGSAPDDSGGGMYSLSSSPTLTNVTISGNSAASNGGGVFNDSSSPTLINVTVSGNSATSNGGGIYNGNSSNAVLINVVISGNSAGWDAGGIENDTSNPTLTNVTISGNSSSNGGGMLNVWSAAPQIRNSIIWGNTASAEYPGISNLYGSVPVIGASLIQGSGGSGAWVALTGTDNGGNLDEDPLFMTPVPLAPGTGGNLRLRQGSPVIDAGDDALLPADSADLDGDGNSAEPLPLDRLGNPRQRDIPAVGSALVDMGAYEASPFLFVGAGLITTVAGNGTPNFNGDGGPATAAEINNPFDVALDSAGNLYIADYGNNRIRRVDAASGVITTVAGTGAAGYNGDGGPATIIQLNGPRGVALDSADNLYIADQNNNRIRRVDAATGIITTVVGIGSPGFSGDGGPATAAALQNPFDLTLDSANNLYIADQDNNRIRRVDAASGIITTVAGSGAPGYSGDGGPATAAELHGPVSVALDGADNIYIADWSNQRVRRVDAASGVITTVAGSGAAGYSGDDGPATAAQLNIPSDVALDSAGNLYITDFNNQRVRRVDAASGVITTVVGSGAAGYSGDGGPATAAQLFNPTGMAIDGAGNLYIADYNNQRIRLVGANIAPTITPVANQTIAESGTTGALAVSIGDAETAAISLTLSAESANPALVPPANIALGGSGANRTVTLTPAPGLSGTAAITLTVSDGILSASTSFLLTVTAVNDPPTLDPIAPRTVFNSAGAQSVSLSGIASGDPDQSQALSVSATSSNPALVPDPAVSYTSPMTTATLSFTPVVSVTGVATITVRVSDDGSPPLFVEQSFAVTVSEPPTIVTVAGTGAASFSGDGGPATAATLYYPRSVALDSAGNLYIADSDNHRIRKVDVGTGIITTVAGTGTAGFNGDGGLAAAATLYHPRTVFLDSADNLYIADMYNHRVRRVDAGTGVITTIAGNGAGGYSGDGGPATTAQLNWPTYLTVDSAGNLYIADQSNHRVRRVDAASGIITTVAGTGVVGYSGDGGPATGAQLHVPAGLFLDSAGDLYICDADNERIRKVNLVTGIITTIVGTGVQGFSGDGGLATAAQLDGPSGMVGDSAGNLYFADFNNQRIRRVDAASGVITTVAGSGTAGYSGDGGPATAAQLQYPNGLAIDSAGKLYFADEHNHRVRLVSYNTAPTIAPVADQSIAEDGTTGALAVTIGDAESAAASLTLSAESANPALVPPANIALGGSGANRTITLTPAPGLSGTAAITLTVSDGLLSASTSFLLTVSAVNDPPVASDGVLTTDEDVPASGTLVATDSDSASLTYVLVADGSRGTATISDPATGAYTYTPNPDASGADSFTFQAADGMALAFDGTDDYASAPLDGTGLSQVTVEMWVRPTANASRGIFQWTNALLADYLFVYFYDDNGTFQLYIDEGYRLSTPLPRDSWTHLAATYDGTTWRLYKNGALAGTYVGGTSSQGTAQALYFGRAFHGYWQGQIDEARVWSVARSEAEIAAAMSTSLQGNEPGLLSYYRFEDGPGSATVTNAVGAGAAATLTSMDPAGAWVGSSALAASNIATVSVTINPVNDPPTLDPLSPLAIAEDAGPQSVALSGIAGGAPDEAQTLTVTVDTNDLHLISPPTVTYTSPMTAGSLSFTPVADASGTAMITVRVADDGTPSLFVEQSLLVDIAPVNDPPTAISLSNSTVAELLPAGSLVGTLSASDVDGGPGFSYSLASGAGDADNGSFSLSGANLLTAEVFDYETRNSYSIRVAVDDGNGGSYSEILLITVSNVDGAPTITSAAPPDGQYGQSYSHSFSADGEPAASFALAGGSLPPGLSLTPDGLLSGTLTQAGTFPLTISAGNGVLPDATAAYTLVVSPAPLLVIADSQSRVYGEANPPLSITIIGFVLGDDLSSLDVLPTASTEAAPDSPLGSYAITVGGGSDPNYSFSYVEGTLTIIPAGQTPCAGSVLRALLRGAGPVIDLDGSCRYTLTETSGSNGHLVNLFARSNLTIDGHGATIEGSGALGLLMIVDSADVTLRNLTLTGGRAGGASTELAGRGGGLMLYNSSVTLDGVKILDSSAALGGGLATVGGSTTVINSLFAGNQAGETGAAIFAQGPLSVRSSTLADRAMNPGAAIFAWDTLSVEGSIIANHAVGIAAAGGASKSVGEDYNLFAQVGERHKRYNPGTQISGSEHSLTAAAADEQFVNPAGHDYHLQAGSAAIDRGSPADSTFADADGNFRPFGNSYADIGAYELQDDLSVAVRKLVPRWVVPERPFATRLVVTNRGRSPVSGLELRDTLPTSISPVSGSLVGAHLDGATISWELTTLEPNQSVMVTYEATAAATTVSDGYQVIRAGDGSVAASGRPVTLTLTAGIVASLRGPGGQIFAPERDGLGFSAWRDQTASAYQRVETMYRLFGPGVCARGTEGSAASCVLTATATRQSQSLQRLISDGRTFGMAAVSLKLFRGEALADERRLPADYQPGAITLAELPRFLELEQMIDLYQAARLAGTHPAAQSLASDGSAADLVGVLLAGGFDGPTNADDYVLHLRQQGVGGTTLLPYALEDRGGGSYGLYVYDPDAPGDGERVVTLDTGAGTWAYSGVGAQYSGDGTSRSIVLRRLDADTALPRACGFCAQAGAAQGFAPAADEDTGLVFILSGPGALLVSDSEGRRIGADPAGGATLNEIPGAWLDQIDLGPGEELPPVIHVPAGGAYSVAIFGTAGVSATVDLSVTAPGLFAELGGLPLRGADDPVVLSVNPETRQIDLTAGGTSTSALKLTLALEAPDGNSYSFATSGVALPEGATLSLAFDPTADRLTLSDDDEGRNQRYNLELTRVEPGGATQTLQRDNITGGLGAGASLDLEGWAGTDWPTTTVIPNRIFVPSIVK